MLYLNWNHCHHNSDVATAAIDNSDIQYLLFFQQKYIGLYIFAYRLFIILLISLWISDSFKMYY